MTIEAEVLHIHPGRKQEQRREVTLLASTGSRIEGYFWMTNYPMELVASLLEAAQHQQRRVRVTGTDSFWGLRVTWAEWAEPVEKSA